jgi:hypothetical protein
MKFAALSLSLFSSFAFGIHEAELIESRKGERIHLGDVKEGLCHNMTIDANMLIARVSSFQVNIVKCIVYRGY